MQCRCLRSLITTTATVAALVFGPATAQADYSLTILHTNDFHSRFGPIDRWDNDCSVADNSAGKCFGGSARLITAINEARERADNSVLLDAGDQFPALNHPVELGRDLAAELMNRMGYDAMTPGNHEFDDGTAALLEFIDRLQFPVLVANIDLSDEPQLAEKTQRSIVVARGGEELGLIGVALEWDNAMGGYKTEVATIDATVAVQDEVDRLTALGVDKIIVVSHMGYHADERLAQSTTGVDVIVGAHTHTYLSNTYQNAQGPYPTMVNGVAVVQTYAFGNVLGALTANFDDEGSLIEAYGDPITLDASVVEDQEIKALVDAAVDGRN